MATKMSTTVTQGVQDIVSNTTQVKIKTITTTDNGSHNLNGPSGTIKVYNTKTGTLIYNKSFSHDIGLNTTTTIFEKTITLAHNIDGTLDIKVVVTFVTGISAGTLTNEVLKTLTTIPRKSTVTAMACDIGAATTITVNRYSSSFTHTLQYGYGSSPSTFYTIVNKTPLTSWGWYVPEEAYQHCINSSYVYITIRCYTYSGTTLVGTSTCSFKATANKDDNKPSVSIDVAEDINSHSLTLTGNKNSLIKGVSTLSYKVSATAKNGATRKSVAVSNGNQSLAAYSGQFAKATSGTIKATVTDSRGYSNSAEKKLTFIDYTPLSFAASVKWNAPTNNIIDITLSGNYSAINFGAKSNSLILRYKCIPKSLFDANENNLTNAPLVTVPVSATIANGKYTAKFQITKTTSSEDGTPKDLDYHEAYTFRFFAADAVYDNSNGYSQKYATQHLAPTIPIFDWGKNDFQFNVPVKSSHNDMAYRQIHGISGADIAFGVGGGGVNRGIYDYTQNKWLVKYEGNNVYIADSAREYAFGKNKILASPIQYMTEAQTVDLKEPISAQPHGIVLVFSRYDTSSDGTVSGNLNHNLNYFFVPKSAINTLNTETYGSVFLLVHNSFHTIGTKYLYFTDTTISGHNDNTKSGTTNGITFDNKQFVLYYVIGV